VEQKREKLKKAFKEKIDKKVKEGKYPGIRRMRSSGSLTRKLMNGMERVIPHLSINPV